MWTLVYFRENLEHFVKFYAKFLDILVNFREQFSRIGEKEFRENFRANSKTEFLF